MLEDNQNKNLTIHIVPEADEEVFSLKISKKWIKICLYSVGFFVILLTGILFFYFQQYQMAAQEVNSLIPYKKKVRDLKDENDYLQSKLAKLSQQTEKIKKQFNQIKAENRQIKEMIDFKNNDELSAKQDINTTKTANNKFPQANTVSTNSQNFSSSKLINSTKHNLSSLDKGIHQRKRELSNLKEDVINYKDYLAAKPKGWPILGHKGRITSEYGYRFHPIEKERIFHEGIDIGVWYNHKVIATGHAKVVFAGWKSGYGRVVILDHGYGYRTLYGHNNKLLVRVGEIVKRGEAIALSGNSGRSTGPHVHYEVLVNGRHTNPKQFFN